VFSLVLALGRHLSLPLDMPSIFKASSQPHIRNAVVKNDGPQVPQRSIAALCQARTYFPWHKWMRSNYKRPALSVTGLSSMSGEAAVPYSILLTLHCIRVLACCNMCESHNSKAANSLPSRFFVMRGFSVWLRMWLNSSAISIACTVSY
jgi:hypothetical protein